MVVEIVRLAVAVVSCGSLSVASRDTQAPGCGCCKRPERKDLLATEVVAGPKSRCRKANIMVIVSGSVVLLLVCLYVVFLLD